MHRTVIQYNKHLQSAITQFASSVRCLDSKVFEETVAGKDQTIITRENDALNLFDVFIPVNVLANTMCEEIIGHSLDDAIVPKYDFRTKTLSLDIESHIIIGITEYLPSWTGNSTPSQPYYYYNHVLDKETSSYLLTSCRYTIGIPIE